MAICDPCLGDEAIYNPACHPQCLTDADCSFNKACLNHACIDPCPGSCGVNAYCTVILHTPSCSCPREFTGNPFESCIPRSKYYLNYHVIDLYQYFIKAEKEPEDSCDTVMCGANAVCLQEKNSLSCQCKPGFFGNPWIECRPECVLNSDCDFTSACINNKCLNPCTGACGVNAKCEVMNHIPICYCPPQTSGDPFVSCYQYTPPYLPPAPSPTPCDPSPCGPFSRCLVSPQGFATCSCLPSYKGTPPACQPECIVSSDCSQTTACVNQKCIDPCPGSCGINAICHVINHNPICSCPEGQIGDPFTNCYTPVVIPEPEQPKNPCVPSPCGPNSVCQVQDNRPVCSCVANYIGSPPNCRPECVINQECPQDKACIREKCTNPCIGTCGENSKCNVVNHTPFCTCIEGYIGDAFIGCTKIEAPPTPRNPCEPSPCGDNAQCTVTAGVARCSCIPPYIGNPYAGGCRPECTSSADCPSNLACLAQNCRDPCQGVCGVNAECTVVNHVPVCGCPAGLTGDPFTVCKQPPSTRKYRLFKSIIMITD